jgi:hypothetical protein
MDAAPKGLRLGRRVDRPTYQPNIAADRKTGSSCCHFGVARKNQEQDAHDVGGGGDRSVSTNPPRLFCSARVRTWHQPDMPTTLSDVRFRGQSGSPVPGSSGPFLTPSGSRPSATLFKTDRSSRSAGPQKRTKDPRCRPTRGARGCEPAPRTPHPLYDRTELSLALPCPAGIARMYAQIMVKVGHLRPAAITSGLWAPERTFGARPA